MDGNSYFLILFSLTFLYGFSFVYALLRSYKLHKFSGNWGTKKIFYVSLMLQAFIRLSTFALMTWALPRNIEGKRVFFLLISIPDTLFIVSYFLLFLQMIVVFYFSHMDNDLQMGLLVHFTKPKHLSASKILGLVTLFWLLIEAMLYALFFKGYVSKTDIQYEIAHVNILCSLVILTFLIFLHINYAMTPFKSNISRDKVQKITSVMFLWTISRYVKGNYDLLIILQPNVLIRNIYDIENATLTQAISLVLMLTLCEIICYVAVLDYSFMTIFLFPDDEVVQHAALFDPHGHTVIEEDEEKYLLPVRLSIMDASNPLIDFKEVIIIDTLAKKVHGFGEIFRATYKGREICYRKVNFKRMTTSVLEEITTEIGALKSIENPILVNFYGACFTLPSICVATSYMKNGSLFAYLHESNRILDYNQKLDLISSIARGIRDLHSQNKIHGHLSTHNVLLDDAYSPKISDLGLEKIKKYAGDLLGYENKNAWSSPQVFREPGKSIKRAQCSDDVYSFGVIIWEIMTQLIPYDGKTLDVLSRFVGLDGNTPQIPQSLQPEIITLIKSCWEFEPDRRPDFRRITMTLASLRPV